MKHYDVVAAVVVVDNKILCMQKGVTKFPYTSYKFEFPGGKIEPGETPQEALRREMREELLYSIVVDDKIATIDFAYPDFSITMTAFWCTAKDTQITYTEHVKALWLAIDDLPTIDWAAADVEIVNAILSSGKIPSELHELN